MAQPFLLDAFAVSNDVYRNDFIEHAIPSPGMPHLFVGIHQKLPPVKILLVQKGATLILGFCGSYCAEDWLLNFNGKPSVGSLIPVRRGFASRFDQCLEILHEIETYPIFKGADTLVVCGHSLGGALANLAYQYFKVSHSEKQVYMVTFASPVVFPYNHPYYTATDAAHYEHELDFAVLLTKTNYFEYVARGALQSCIVYCFGNQSTSAQLFAGGIGILQAMLQARYLSLVPVNSQVGQKIPVGRWWRKLLYGCACAGVLGSVYFNTSKIFTLTFAGAMAGLSFQSHRLETYREDINFSYSSSISNVKRTNVVFSSKTAQGACSSAEESLFFGISVLFSAFFSAFLLDSFVNK